MRHPSARPLGQVLHRIALAGLLAAFLVPLPARAQIPKVRRRAQDAAARAAGVEQPKPQCQAVAFDSVVQELTAARLEQVMKGLRARRQVLDGRRGAPGWNALVSRRDAAASEAAALSERHGGEIDAYRQRRTAIEQCRDEQFRERKRVNEAALQTRAMTDQAFMQKYAELAQQMADAQQRGDTAAMHRLMAEVQTLTDPTRDDSLAVDRHCGRLPAPPVPLVRLDSLRALEDSLNAQLRRREQEADTVAMGASGLTAQQMAMGQERAEMFLAKLAAEAAPCGFSEVEVTALRARRAELDELL